MVGQFPVYWPIEVGHVSKFFVLWRGIWLLWLIRRVTGLSSLLWYLVLEARCKANLFEGDSASSTLGLKKLKIDLSIQLDKVIDLVFPKLPD